MPDPNKNEPEKASGAVFVYEDPKTGELFHFSRRGTYRKNGRILVFVKKAKGEITSQQKTDYIEAIRDHLETDEQV